MTRTCSRLPSMSVLPSVAHPTQSDHDPRLLLGYDPDGTVGDIIQLPCQTTLSKVAASQYVELWHFTAEGIAVGFRKGTNFTDGARRFMDQLGTELELPKAAIPDQRMSFEMYFHAARKHLETIRHVAMQQIDPVKRTILNNEAAIWAKAYSGLSSRQGSWAMTAKYSALLRHYYYTCTIGMTRPNPAKWQTKLWDHVISVRQGNLWEGTLPYESLLGLPGSASSTAPAHTTVAPPARPPRQSYRGGHQGPSRPFRSGPSGVSRAASGACFICGRTQRDLAHDVYTCKPQKPQAAAAMAATSLGSLCSTTGIAFTSQARVMGGRGGFGGSWRFTAPRLISRRRASSSVQ
ncbi:unnamed protein product, partial [Tilletia laevis]